MKIVFKTFCECKTLSGLKIDVQSFIETPELNLLGRCRSNHDQFGLIETLTGCLKEFNVRLHTRDIPIANIMRFSHGDEPAMQFEAENQKAGNYFRLNCDIDYIQADDISNCYQSPIANLSSK